MDIPKILPDLGAPVSTRLLNVDEFDDASLGEVMHAATVLMQVASQRMANPATYTEIPTYIDAAGRDWSGFHGESTPTDSPAADSTATAEKTEPSERNFDEEIAAPIEPDNYCDSLPALGNMLSQISRFHASAMTQYSRYLEASMADQRRYLGTPRKTKDFRDVADYLTTTMRISRADARKIIKRGKYFAHRPGLHPEASDAKPTFEKLAESMASGDLPIDNADKLISFDEELIKYSQKTKQPLERKDQVLEVFEPVMVETAESTTPDELSKVKKRWLEEMVHWICPDGPSPSRAFAKEADNALKYRDQADGSAIFSMHATPAVTASFKNWMLQQLDLAGSPVLISDEALTLLDFLTPDTDTDDTATNNDVTAASHETRHGTEESSQPKSNESSQLESDWDSSEDNADDKDQQLTIPSAWLGSMTTWDTSPDPTQVVAESADGTLLTSRDMNLIEKLTTGQKMGSILLSHMLALLSMDPTEFGGKKAHGISAQLMVVQDIETAYHTLGLGSIPEAARRPAGPDGYLPPVIKRPNPDDPNEPECLDNPYQFSQHVPPDPVADDDDKPPPWTPYQSEAVNIGPIHPDEVESLLCNATITGQIWNGPDQVLQQKRAHRLHTAAQRRAILARDKGCQAPGCPVPAAYCDIHHIKAWTNGGPTDEDNGIALCPFHHDALHQGRWTIRKHNGLTFFQPARWIDPAQPLLRNAYWNT